MQKNISLYFTVFLCFFLVKNSFSQGTIIPLGNDAYHIIDRLEIKTGVPFSLGTGLKPYLRGDVIRYATDLDTSRLLLSGKDRKDLFWLFKDSNEWLSQSENPTTLTGKNEKVDYQNDDNITKLGSQVEASRFNRKFIERTPILKYFYKTPANFFQLDNKDVFIRANPIINVKYFKDANDDKIQFFNQRGLELRGGIDDRILFYANVLETQANFAVYVRDRIARDTALPGANLYKDYQSSFIDSLSGYDYSIANGYVGFNLTKHVGFQFGHGNSYIGDGIRSLIFSDFSPNHLYFKFNTRFGKFQYQNLFTEMRTTPYLKGDNFAPKKHVATHFLNYNIAKNLSFGVFESIVYGNRPGSGWDINYFNPIIFYRSVEYLGNSADNAILGAQGKWNFLNRFSLYGQFLLDEFNFALLFPKGNTPKGWWANKYGIQAGLKYVDVLGIDHLDAQFEYNSVRPFTYSHSDYFTNYANSNQPIAHPIGANFNESIVHLRYQPTPKFVIETRFLKIKTGEDSTKTKSYGQNVVRSYNLKANDYGNFIGQGAKADVSMLSVDMSYQFFHNMYADLHYFYRKQKSDLATRNQNTNYIGGGIRINISNRRNEF
jgi:hypothetical protein